jgi:hypothetical protein
VSITAPSAVAIMHAAPWACPGPGQPDRNSKSSGARVRNLPEPRSAVASSSKNSEQMPVIRGRGRDTSPDLRRKLWNALVVAAQGRLAGTRHRRLGHAAVPNNDQRPGRHVKPLHEVMLLVIETSKTLTASLSIP